MILSLFWKESREHLWKMLTLLAILVIAIVLTETPWLRDSWEPVWIAASVFGPIWLAAQTITSEKARRTAITLAALPTSPTLIFLIKTVVATLTFELPLALTLLMGAHWLNPADRPAFFAMLLVAATLYVLILCVGMGIQREGMAAMVGLLVLLISGILYVVLMWLPQENGGELAGWWLLTANPFGIELAIGGHRPLIEVALAMQLLVTAAYWMLGAYRYRRNALPFLGAEKVPAQGTRLVAENVSTLRHPLFWKERREQLPILVLSAVVGVGLAILFGTLLERNSRYRHLGLATVNTILILFFMMSMLLPTIIAAVLGISAVSGDLEDSTAAFWQSRPIRAASLFWTKYAFALVGILALLFFFEIPYFISAHFHFFPEDSAPVINGAPTHLLIGQLLWLPLVLGIAVFCSILFRRTVYAAIAMIVAVLTLVLFPINAHDTLTDVLFTGSPSIAFLPVAAFTLVAAGTLAVLSRLAFAKDWRIG